MWTSPRSRNCWAEKLTEIRRSMPGRVPGLELARRGAQHPLAEGQDQARLLGHGDERDRRQEALLRMLPAHERLEAHDPARRDADERLVVQQRARRGRAPGAGRSGARAARRPSRSARACRARSCCRRGPWRGTSPRPRCAAASRRPGRRPGYVATPTLAVTWSVRSSMLDRAAGEAQQLLGEPREVLALRAGPARARGTRRRRCARSCRPRARRASAAARATAAAGLRRCGPSCR